MDPSLKSTKVDIETLLAVRVSKRIRAGEARWRTVGRKRRRERKKAFSERQRERETEREREGKKKTTIRNEGGWKESV